MIDDFHDSRSELAGVLRRRSWLALLFAGCSDGIRKADCRQFVCPDLVYFAIAQDCRRQVASLTRRLLDVAKHERLLSLFMNRHPTNPLIANPSHVCPAKEEKHAQYAGSQACDLCGHNHNSSATNMTAHTHTQRFECISRGLATLVWKSLLHCCPCCTPTSQGIQ